MAGLYAADGSWNISVVTGAALTGKYAADGSLNCVIEPIPSLTPTGLQHPCGAYWITRAIGASASRSAADGSLNVSTTPYTLTYAQRVTVVSGVLP